MLVFTGHKIANTSVYVFKCINNRGLAVSERMARDAAYDAKLNIDFVIFLTESLRDLTSTGW